MTEAKPGVRLRCEECGTEIVVVKADGVLPTCCDTVMVSLMPGSRQPTAPPRQ
jgi:hypothetical protein